MNASQLFANSVSAVNLNLQNNWKLNSHRFESKEFAIAAGVFMALEDAIINSAMDRKQQRALIAELRQFSTENTGNSSADIILMKEDILAIKEIFNNYSN